MASAQQPPREPAEQPAARGPGGGPAPRLVVDLSRGHRSGRYRIEAPDRVLRMWFLLNAVAEERSLGDLPPESQARIRRMLGAVSDELSRSVSPDLADELRHLLGWGEAGPEATELRIAYASLLGWAGGLAISMLSQLEARRGKPHPARDGPGQRAAGETRQGPAGAGRHHPPAARAAPRDDARPAGGRTNGPDARGLRLYGPAGNPGKARYRPAGHAGEPDRGPPLGEKTPVTGNRRKAERPQGDSHHLIRAMPAEGNAPQVAAAHACASGPGSRTWGAGRAGLLSTPPP